MRQKVIAIELRHIKIPKNTSSSARTVQLAKTKAISHLLTNVTALFPCHATLKLGILQKDEPCRAAKRQFPIGFLSDKPKNSEGKVAFNFEI